MTIYPFQGFWNCHSICGLDTFEGKNSWQGKTVILLTELSNNEGTSITNAIEILARELISKDKFNDTVLVEYYDDSGYSEVVFTDNRFTNPDWKFLTEEEFNNSVKNNLDK